MLSMLSIVAAEEGLENDLVIELAGVEKNLEGGVVVLVSSISAPPARLPGTGNEIGILIVVCWCETTSCGETGVQ